MTTESRGAYERAETTAGHGLLLVMSAMVVLGVLGIFLVSN